MIRREHTGKVNLVAVCLALAMAGVAGGASATTDASASSFITANNCIEHQAFVEGNGAAVASRLPRGCCRDTERARRR